MSVIYKPVWSQDGKTLTNVLVKDKYETYNITTEWYDGTLMDDTKVDDDLVYVEYEGKYLVRNFEYGQVLQKDTMQEMRDLSSYEVLLLKMGVYKHVQLNGYYEKGDTPTPIDYKLSDTSDSDDGGSIVEVGEIRLEHKFIDRCNVRYYGASEDIVNNEYYINKVFEKNKVVYIPEGNFRINVGDSHTTGGIIPKDNSKLIIDGKILVNPNPYTNYSAINLTGKEFVDVQGRGYVIGDRDDHEGDTGEWGMGITCYSSKNINIEGVTVQDCWGDGLYIGGRETDTESFPSENVIIDNVRLVRNRRQGASVVNASNIHFKNSVFKDTEGTLPQAGLDIEPNPNTKGVVENITIEDCIFTNNATGLLVYSPDDSDSKINRVVVRRCYFDKNVTNLSVVRGSLFEADDCVFENAVGDFLGDIVLSCRSVIITNCTVLGSSTTTNTGLIAIRNSYTDKSIAQRYDISRVNLQGETSGIAIRDSHSNTTLQLDSIKMDVKEGWLLNVGTNMDVIEKVVIQRSDITGQILYTGSANSFRYLEISRNKLTPLRTTSTSYPFVNSYTGTGRIVIEDNDILFVGNESFHNDVFLIRSDSLLLLNNNIRNLKRKGGSAGTNRVIYLEGKNTKSEYIVDGNLFIDCEVDSVIRVRSNTPTSITLTRNSLLGGEASSNFLEHNTTSYDPNYSANIHQNNIGASPLLFNYEGQINTIDSYNNILNGYMVLKGNQRFEQTATTTRRGGVRQSTAQPNSSATQVTQLVSDFNSLLVKMRTAGLLEE